MGFVFKKIKMVLPLLLVAAYVWGQATDAKNFTATNRNKNQFAQTVSLLV